MEQVLEITQPIIQSGQWTYQDYLNLPDDGKRYEIIEGELYVTNAPSLEHQSVAGEIFGEMRQFVKSRKLGRVLSAPCEVHLSPTTRPVQPDVLFIRAENWPAPSGTFFDGAPDLVVEVLSPSSTRTDRVVKFNVYEKFGVAEYWIVNLKTQSVEVFTLSGGEYALLGEFAGDEVIQSVVLAGLEIVTNTLFEAA